MTLLPCAVAVHFLELCRIMRPTLEDREDSPDGLPLLIIKASVRTLLFLPSFFSPCWALPQDGWHSRLAPRRVTEGSCWHL
jgi:hypothetical protein